MFSNNRKKINFKEYLNYLNTIYKNIEIGLKFFTPFLKNIYILLELFNCGKELA